ncbi:hypothetical protein ACFE04_016724 [Oxalis oulophora]
MAFAAELVNAATSDKLTQVDWTKFIHISEFVAHDQRQAKDVVKAIKKRLGSQISNTQLYALSLLEILMNNIGDPIHKQVIHTRLLSTLVKLVKQKSDSPVRERIFLLLDATQTTLGGASGTFPQYHSAYLDLVNAGVKFAQMPEATVSNDPSPQPMEKNTLNGELNSSRREIITEQAESKVLTESRIIQKATNAFEVLREVLDAVDKQNPELLSSCWLCLSSWLGSKGRVYARSSRAMFIPETRSNASHYDFSFTEFGFYFSSDEKLVSRAIALNDQLQRVLERHDALLSRNAALPNGSSIATSNHRKHEEGGLRQGHNNHDEVKYPRENNHVEVDQGKTHNHEEAEEEEEAGQLLRRIRKGKACVKPEDEEQHSEKRSPFDLFGASFPAEKLNCPLVRPLSSELPHEPSPVAIPPPPAKQMEREKFFQEKKLDGSTLATHVRGLSLYSRNASSSHSGSVDLSD